MKQAVFSMGVDKSPGEDGLNPEFFQHFWDIIESEVSSFCISCIANRYFSEDINNTLLVLIQKKKK